eukprot:gene8933-31897_t
MEWNDAQFGIASVFTLTRQSGGTVVTVAGCGDGLQA